eukprot:TRINITY_DN32527_c0_g1_i1.p1 TRINITY_DN32527_c0_g1~~TRINITY_DN32527_c0_g1_i1.p1  ORF type:complete len:109 (+),score=1.47 TRINITY_DN32527_c0_g1_i1:61-387(+)
MSWDNLFSEPVPPLVLPTRYAWEIPDKFPEPLGRNLKCYAENRERLVAEAYGMRVFIGAGRILEVDDGTRPEGRVALEVIGRPENSDVRGLYIEKVGHEPPIACAPGF